MKERKLRRRSIKRKTKPPYFDLPLSLFLSLQQSLRGAGVAGVHLWESHRFGRLPEPQRGIYPETKNYKYGQKLP